MNTFPASTRQLQPCEPKCVCACSQNARAPLFLSADIVAVWLRVLEAIGKVDAEEAVAHSLFADTALVSGAEVVLSDCDSENEDAQGASTDADAGLVASAEVIGFSDGDDDEEGAMDAMDVVERGAWYSFFFFLQMLR